MDLGLYILLWEDFVLPLSNEFAQTNILRSKGQREERRSGYFISHFSYVKMSGNFVSLMLIYKYK